jgi:hypothetical protein
VHTGAQSAILVQRAHRGTVGDISSFTSSPRDGSTLKQHIHVTGVITLAPYLTILAPYSEYSRQPAANYSKQPAPEYGKTASTAARQRARSRYGNQPASECGEQPVVRYAKQPAAESKDSPYETSGCTSFDKTESFSLIIRRWCCSGVIVHLDAHCIIVFGEKFTSRTTSFVA